MSSDPRFREIIKGVALGSTDTARQVGDQLTAIEHGQLNEFGTAVMALCLEHRFKDDASTDAIRQFVAEMRKNYANSRTGLNFFTIEGVIRGFAGDEAILDEISPEDQMQAQFPIIRKIVAESEVLRNDLEALFDEADRMIAEWENE